MLRLIHRSVVQMSQRLLPSVPSQKGQLVGRMFSVQDSLPQLPVPPLEQTLQKYLLSVKPLVTEQEFENTREIVKRFEREPGPHLQSYLEKRFQSSTNWMADWWMQVAYLDVRCPVTINSNPGVLFPLQDYRGPKEQLKFAAKFISGVLDYKIMIDEQELPVEHLGGKPLCMMQYYKILSACRIPGVKSDKWHCFPSNEPDPPTHIVVACNNQFFALEVYGKGKPLSVEQLYQQLKLIQQNSNYAAPPVGILTMQNRNQWGKLYKKLIKEKINKASLEAIHQSIFVLCLDKPGFAGDAVTKWASEARQMLHGDGSQWNSGSRWFDKTLQFIIGQDGVCGLNYEHTSAEGPPIAAIIDHVLTYCGQNKESVLPAAGLKHPFRLKFNLDDDDLQNIENAKVNSDIDVRDLDLTLISFNEFGKDFIKSAKLSPDAFIQVAMQLAYYRFYKEPCATYESGSTRRFQLGRTDTIRSCSVASYNFTRGMDSSSMSVDQKEQLLREAVQSHKMYTNETINGQGIDRHLLGLKLAAVENGMNIPELFMDPVYGTSIHFKMSSSQVSSKHECIMFFGPVVPDGYGFCYNPQSRKILFSISALNTSPDTNSKKMAEVLMQSLADIKDLLNRNVHSKL